MKWIILLVAVSACAGENDAARLDHPRILAVRATPAHALPGQPVRVDVLAGDSSGTVIETAPDRVTAAGVAPERRSDGWYVAAAQPVVPVEVELAIDGELLRASKQLVFGDHADNPIVATMQVDGSDADAIVTEVGATRTLSAAATDVGFAWYSSIGTLDHDRSAQPTFTSDERGDGIVLVVVRDTQGGVAWQQLPVTID